MDWVFKTTKTRFLREMKDPVLQKNTFCLLVDLLEQRHIPPQSWWKAESKAKKQLASEKGCPILCFFQKIKRLLEEVS